MIFCDFVDWSQLWIPNQWFRVGSTREASDEMSDLTLASMLYEGMVGPCDLGRICSPSVTTA